MILLQDTQVLLQLLRGQRAMGASHEERLERFYAPQAGSYDAFRERLLHGRRELIEQLRPAPGEVIVELGGGTGRNIDYFGARLLSLSRFDLVDVCPSLLDIARTRAERWPAIVNIVQADACTYRPLLDRREGVDKVYFSYSLSMMPQWRRALNNAIRMLRPGGLIGVVDFFVSSGNPAPGRARHGWLTRQLLPRWFAHSGVSLSPAPLDELVRRTESIQLHERTGTVPYLPGLRAPYYLYVGRKRSR